MTDDTFYWVLEHIALPVGALLSDGRTYRVIRKDFTALEEASRDALSNFEKFLVLSDGKGHVVGGVLFYGPYDLQAQMFTEYQGMGYMSAIHRNGILRAELEPGQEVTLSVDGVTSVNDFNMKCYLLSLIGLKAKNEDFIREKYLPYMDETDEEISDMEEQRA